MKRRRYEQADAEALKPLLDSIGRELKERQARLTKVETRMAEVRASPFYSGEVRELEAEASLHRRELRYCHGELEELGCTVVGTTPLTIRIPTSVGGKSRSLVWQQSQEARSSRRPRA